MNTQTNNSNTQSNLNGNIYDNPSMFQAILVQDNDNPRQRGRFSIVSPVGPDAAATGGINQIFPLRRDRRGRQDQHQRPLQAR